MQREQAKDSVERAKSPWEGRPGVTAQARTEDRPLFPQTGRKEPRAGMDTGHFRRGYVLPWT